MRCAFKIAVQEAQQALNKNEASSFWVIKRLVPGRPTAAVESVWQQNSAVILLIQDNRSVYFFLQTITAAKPEPNADASLRKLAETPEGAIAYTQEKNMKLLHYSGIQFIS